MEATVEELKSKLGKSEEEGQILKAKVESYETMIKKSQEGKSGEGHFTLS